jgi:hypothetical protein
MLISVPFATVIELEARWRTLSTAEKTRATALLGDASYMVLARCESANEVDDADVQGQAQRAAVLRTIVCAMVQRSMLAGDSSPGVKTAQETAGPFSQSFTYANPTGDLYLTAAEMKLLPCGRQVAFTVPMNDWLRGS